MKLKLTTKASIIKLLMCALIFIMINCISSIGANQINIIINGKRVNFNNSTGYPYVDENNRTMVPLRITMESAGATVGFDENTQTAIIITEHNRIEVPIGTDIIYNNNREIKNDTKAVINNGRTYLPIKAVLEGAYYTVNWDKITQTVNVYSDGYSAVLDENTLIPYSTGDISNLVEQILKGNVIYIKGQYYATSSFANSLATTKVVYNGNDLNTAIYPQKTVIDYDKAIDEDLAYIADLSNFDKILVYENDLDSSIKPFEPSPVPQFVYVYAFYDSSALSIKPVYIVDEITQDFIDAENAAATFNGIRMKKENGLIYFNCKDLIDLGIKYN